MKTNLSFRKESIQTSSSASEAMSPSLAGLMQNQGPRQAHDQHRPAITTLQTITQ